MTFFASFLINVISILKYAILLRVLLSWVSQNHASGLNRFLNEMTEPLLKVCRNLLPRTGSLDISPIIAFLALDLAQWGVFRLFAGIA
mgnify:CR=1 FL=1